MENEKQEEVRIVVMGEVQSQLRPIFVKATGKAVDPPKCRAYKKKVAETAKNFYKGELLDEPLVVDIKIYMGVSKSWSKKKKEQALSGEILPTYKKDLDNLTKGIWDGLSGVVWKDDGCIVDYSTTKRYATVPRAEVRVRRLKTDEEVGRYRE